MGLAVVFPEPQWLRWVNAGLWGLTFGVFGWWIGDSARKGYTSQRSFEVALHFWVMCGIFTYGSLYAAYYDYPVPPHIWIIAAVLVSLLTRMLVRRPGEHDRLS